MGEDRFLEYFITWKAKGYSEEQIKNHLLKSGYPAEIVEKAMIASRVSQQIGESSLQVNIAQKEAQNNMPSSNRSSNNYKKYVFYVGIIIIVLVPILFFTILLTDDNSDLFTSKNHSINAPISSLKEEIILLNESSKNPDLIKVIDSSNSSLLNGED